jgi:AraC-like DNA-binding protein
MHTSLTPEPVSLSAALPVRVARVERGARAATPARFAHFHRVAEIVLFGSVKGVMHTDTERLELCPGCATWVPPMGAHDFALARGAANWTLIQFYQNFTRLRPPPVAMCVTFSDHDRRRISSLADFLAEAVDSGAAQEAQRYLELILLMLERGQHGKGESITPTQALARFRPLLDRLRAAPSAKLPLDEAASLCHLSPAYFSRLFREVFGRGFADYMMQTRLDNAAIALASSPEPVSSVCFQAGFSSHAYFSAQFRRRFGRTPSEFRRQSRRKGSIA